MRLFIEPTEPLLFRTGRPFDAGSDVFAESSFPPTPETIQGALRAAIAVHWGREKMPGNKFYSLDTLFQQPKLVDLIGNSNGYGRFRITGLTLGHRKENDTFERLFPAPTHIIQVKFQGEEQIHQLRLRPEQFDEAKIQSNMPSGMQYLSLNLGNRKLDGKTEPISGWLTPEGLRKALRTGDQLQSDDLVSRYKIFEYEPRLGIGMQNTTKTTREGYLYQVQMVRMRPDYGFIADIRLSKTAEHGGIERPQPAEPESLEDDTQTQEQLGIPTEGWLILGGERRAARFKVLSPEECAQENDLGPKETDNLIYLATPACFKDGWKPKSWPSPLPQPIAASIPRYERIGGWSLNPANSGGESKSIRRCVPAGSVYFFKQPVIVTQPLTDYGWQIGYGITYTGEWQK